MQTLAKQVLEHASRLPEGTPLAAKELLHLGSRAAVDQVLSRLVGRGTLLRAGRGIYVRPVESRFGSRAPSALKMVEGLATQRGETIVPHGAAAANALGLTTQGGLSHIRAQPPVEAGRTDGRVPARADLAIDLPRSNCR